MCNVKKIIRKGEWEMDKQKRIEIVNSLIKYLADYEREFFRYKDRTARFEHDGRNLWFIDHGTNVPMRMTRSSYMNKKQEHNFSGGGTMWGLIRDFTDLFLVMITRTVEMVMVDCTVLIGVGQKRVWKKCMNMQGKSDT